MACGDLERRLVGIGAKFAYMLDVRRREGRTWDNLGRAEDPATGSAAGPAGAYLVRHGAALPGRIELRQGRFVHRPSRIEVCVERMPSGELGVRVDANCVLAGDGRLSLPKGVAGTRSS